MRRPGARSWAVFILAVALGAAPTLGQVSDRDALEAEIKLTVGIAYLNNEDYAEALSRLEQAIELDPENGTAHFLAATSLNRLGRYDESLGHLQTARQHQAQAPPGRIDWFEGEAHYWLSDYDAAENNFQTALDADSADAYTHFYLGLTLLSLNRGREAANHFDRAVSLDEELASNSAFYAGKSYFESGDLSEAKAEFEKALAASEGSENTRKASTNYLAAVDTVKPSGPPKGEIRLSYSPEYDSNVILEPAGGFVGSNVPTDEADFRNTFSLRGALYPFYDKSGWSMGLILNFYQSIHQDLSAFDLTAPQAIISFSWGRDPQGYINGPVNYTRVPVGRTPVVFTMQAAYNAFWLDGNSYLTGTELGASVKIAEGNATSTQIDVDYRDSDFDRFRARTGTYTQLRLIQNIYVGGRRDRTFRIGLRFAVNDANDIEDAANFSAAQITEFGGVSNDYDYDETEVFLDYAMSLRTKIALFFQASYQTTDYDNLNSQTNLDEPDLSALREDKRFILSGSVAWSFTKHFGLTARYTYYKNDSNKTLFEYDRGVAGIGINWYY